MALGDAIHVKHGFAFKGQHFSDSGEFIVLTPGNFYEEGGFRVRPGKDRFYTGDIPEGYVLEEDDLIVAMTEQGPGLLGSSALIPEGGKYLHNQRLGLIQERNGLIDKKFLYYLFNTKAVRGQISGSATGTKVRHTAPERIYRVRVTVPADLNEQKKIASILSAYDDLIENNQRRIQLLEQAARLLYREWFVHLRFPGHEHVRVVDGVPEGWGRKRLSELCTDVRDATDPKTLPPETVYIGLEHIPRRSITLNDWGSAADVDSTKYKFAEGDILFGKIRPYFHKVGFALVDGITSSDAIVIRPNGNQLYHYVLFLLSSAEFVALASKTVREGSKMPRADWKFLLKSEFLLPPHTLLTLFSDTVAPICDQLRNLALMNQQLTQARDLLLPRLMNGEVAV
ncbi:restriction endonuclease subunit S [Methanofollis fontis]|uniref:Restriction endonuclease subunit S n=1 Tax=Methanofollis fontis TaxID=2052832 RepID=A0A483CQF7_9EURY|nr:restriction endonuclease subunit S [Methanofollis fontis]